MSDYKEFTGKGLDDAIEAACSHFGLDRGKLEIEIVSGGSAGIFGLVGKKKAVVKARPRGATPTGGAARPLKTREENRPAVRQEPKAPAVRAEAPAPVKAEAPKPPAVPPKSEVMTVEDDYDGGPDDSFDEEEDEVNFNRFPDDFERPLENKELEALIREAVGILIAPIVGEQELEVIQTKDRIKVVIGGEESAGLLIGREGQTINALQYLVGRIVAKKWPEPVKIQLDAGQYRERQDDKLRQMALYLADKAKTLGRPQSTKPLSSYHRRVVHLALQNDPTVSTRSKGEGPLKRVLIMPRRERGQSRQ